MVQSIMIFQQNCMSKSWKMGNSKSISIRLFKNIKSYQLYGNPGAEDHLPANDTGIEIPHQLSVLQH